MRQVTYLYDDPAHPDRPSGHIEAREWTEDDRALLLALAEYESTLCTGCGQPKHLAWHADMEGWFEAHSWVCHACTAQQGHEVSYSVPLVDKDLSAEKRNAMPEFDLMTTVTGPTPPNT